MRCALIEAETREEVMREMEERMRTMEQMYSRRLMSEVSCTYFPNIPFYPLILECSWNVMS